MGVMYFHTSAAVLCKSRHFFLLTSINNETKAPVCVPNGTAPQQHLLIVQGILLSSKSKSSRELIQFVIWCLTFNFTCKRKVKRKKRWWKSSWPRNTCQYCILSFLQIGNMEHYSCSPLLNLLFPSCFLYLLMFWDIAPSLYSCRNPMDHNKFAFILFFEHGNFVLVEFKTKFPQLLCRWEEMLNQQHTFSPFTASS